MTVMLGIRNESRCKQLYRRAAIQDLADRICAEEGLMQEVEVSVLLCDDAFIRDLNRQYRSKNTPTDVLSFEQELSGDDGPQLLGDIVISLETVARNCCDDRSLMREELSLLFCHGLLHLIGYDHGNAKEKEEMRAKQAHYLGVPNHDAWAFGPKVNAHSSGV